MTLMAHAVNGVVQIMRVTRAQWKRSTGLTILLRRDFGRFLQGTFPVRLVFAQEPALDDEWTDSEEMEINERRIRRSREREVKNRKIEESQIGLECRGLRILAVACSASWVLVLIRVPGANFPESFFFLCRFSHGFLVRVEGQTSKFLGSTVNA